MLFIEQVISAEVALVSTIVKGIEIALRALVGLMVGALLVSLFFSAPLLGVAIALGELARQRLFMVASPLVQSQEDSVDLECEVLAVREVAQDSLESLQVNLSEDLVAAQIAAFDWSREPLKIDSSYWTDDKEYVDSFRSVEPVVAVEVIAERKADVSVVVAVKGWTELCKEAQAHGIVIRGKGRTRSVIEAELSAVLLGKK